MARTQHEDDNATETTSLFQRLATMAPDDPGRMQLRETLIAEHLPVAERLAHRFRHRGEALEDLVQVATVGLINAVDRFDPSIRADFLSYAVPTITGEIRRYFRDTAWSVRMPRRLQELHLSVSSAIGTLSQQHGRAPRPSELAEHLGVSTAEVREALQAASAYRSASLDDVLAGTEGVTLGETLGELDAELAEVEDRETVRPLLEQLSERDRRIVLLRFFQGLSQTQVGERVGLSQVQVSRILSRTLTNLRERLAHQAGGGMADGHR